NPNRGFSNWILINDARPLWLSPGTDAGPSPPSHPFVYRTAKRPGLDRTIKVVGRNLQAAPGKRTQVRLERMGDSPIELTADDDDKPATEIERYVARVTLPAELPVGDYTVKLSRDEVSWVAVYADSVLTVRPDPAPRYQVDVSTFADPSSGPCLADDDVDDTPCITRAIRSAEMLGGGDVVFPAGTWLVDRNCWGAGGPASTGSDTYQFTPGVDTTYATCQGGVRGYGIFVPAHVSLVAS